MRFFKAIVFSKQDFFLPAILSQEVFEAVVFITKIFFLSAIFIPRGFQGDSFYNIKFGHDPRKFCNKILKKEEHCSSTKAQSPDLA